MNLEQGDLVLCTVERIEGTLVFVKIHEGNRELDGTIVFSEIAPGRIRNIRDYVVPKKRIVCKILRISSTGNIELSLRRVTPKEKKETLEKFNLEKSYISVMKNVLGEKTSSIVDKIKEEGNVYDFIEESKENPGKLEKVAGKNEAEKILEIIKSQRKKNAVLKKEISLKISEPDGLNVIKNLLGKINDVEVRYISAGRYSVKAESEDLKKADQKLRNIFSDIEKESKKKGYEFSVIEK